MKGEEFRWERGAAVILLLVGVALAMWAAATQAGTYDEVTFLGVGRYLWHTGDFGIQHTRFHPPLMYYVNSIFLELGPGRWDLGLDAQRHFTYFAGQGYMYRGGQSPDAVLLLARYPFILLFVLLGAIVYRWARDVFTPGGALLSLSLYVLSPTLLAHASIAGNDFLLTVTYTSTLFLLWKALRRGGVFLWLGVGMLLGLTMLTKATGMVLWGVIPLLMLWSWWLARHTAWPRALSWKDLLGQGIGVAGVAVFTLMAGYGFYSLPAMTQETRPHRWVDRLVGWLGEGVRMQVYSWVEHPIPGYRYVTMLKRQFRHVAQGHEAYLLGRRSLHGWWYFFPVSMSIKTPLGTLVLWVGGWALALRGLWADVRARRWNTWAWVVWWAVPVMAVLGPAMMGNANMGVRLVLPIYPFLFLFAGAVGDWAYARRGRLLGVGIVVALVACSVFSQAPRYLSYVNEAWGGPENGWRYVGDSNYDWGQGLKELKAYLDAHDIHHVYLAYFGGELPEERGIHYTWLPCHPVRGVVAISVTYLQGLYLEDPSCYAWLRSYTPVARVGHTIWVYDLR